MKRYFVLFLFLGALSCDKDAEENSIPLNASKIVGSWQIVSEGYSIGGPLITKTIKDGGILDKSALEKALRGTPIGAKAKPPKTKRMTTLKKRKRTSPMKISHV